MEQDKYVTQKKYLSESRKQLRVWVDAEKYAVFQDLVKKNGTSIYALVNQFIDDYIRENQ